MGWATFAAIMLFVGGFWGVIVGIAGIAENKAMEFIVTVLVTVLVGVVAGVLIFAVLMHYSDFSDTPVPATNAPAGTESPVAPATDAPSEVAEFDG